MSMSDILQGLGSGAKNFVLAWLFPALLAVSTFAYLVFPAFETLELGKEVKKLDVAQRLAVVGFSALVIAVILNAISTPLYRVLEGYYWPSWVRKMGKKRQRNRRDRLQKAFDEKTGTEQGLAFEKLQRFPVDDEQIAPSRLGNALRSSETYGWDHFRLDSQTFWTELTSVAPDAMSEELQDSRSAVDFFVSSAYLSLLIGVLGLVGNVRTDFDELRLIVATVVAVILVPVSYSLAVMSSSRWLSAMKALVNVGRKPLAEGLGLRLPSSLQEEREMWELLTTFVSYAYKPGWQDELIFDSFRDSPAIANKKERLRKAACLKDLIYWLLRGAR